MTVRQIIVLLVSLIVGPLSAQYLKPENYGLLGYGSTIIIIFSSIASLGLGSVLVYELVTYPEKQASLIGSALALRLVASLVCYVMSIICVIILEPGYNLLWAIVGLQSLTIVFQTYDVFEAWFQMKLEMKYVSIAMIIVTLVTAAWQIGLLVFKAPVLLFAASGAIGAFLSGLILIIFFNKRSRLQISFSFADAKYLLSKSYHFVISGLAIVIYMQIDKLMIGKMIDVANVGIYEVAVNLAIVWQFVPFAMINSARPIVLESKKKDNELYFHYLKTTFLLVSIVCICASIFFVIMGKNIISILYGEDYINAASSLGVLVWATMISMIGSTRSIWILGEQLSKYDKYFAISAAVLNIFLNYFLIKKLGIMGAAISTLITYFYEVFIAPLFFKDTRGFVKLYFSSWKEFPRLINAIKKKK